MAYRGATGEQARLGALLEAEAFDHLRLVAEFCTAFVKGGQRR